MVVLEIFGTNFESLEWIVVVNSDSGCRLVEIIQKKNASKKQGEKLGNGNKYCAKREN